MNKKIANHFKLKILFFFIILIVFSNIFSANNEINYTEPGDNKKGYESKNYKTNSMSLINRVGKKSDLIKYVSIKQLGLPQVPQPKNNIITNEKILLGKKLFFDRRLSINNTMSCAMCHIPEQGFTNNEIKTAIGIEGRSNLRNAPTLFNVAFNKFFFHDAREFSLENQVWQPILEHTEMGMPSFGFTLKKLNSISEYKKMFNDAFPGEGMTVENLGKAIASYERVLISGNSNFDKWYYGGDKNAISKDAKKGFDVFSGKGNCASCHTIGRNDALFLDNKLHNTGIGYKESMGSVPDKKTKVQISPGEYINIDNEIVKSVNQQKKLNDLGLYRITENPDHRWLFKTPTLRNISLTAPYMHNGVFNTLEEVIDFYDKGGIKNELLSPIIKELNLSIDEKNNLKVFLETLTGDNFAKLVADALSEQIGDITADDTSWVNKNDMDYIK